MLASKWPILAIDVMVLIVAIVMLLVAGRHEMFVSERVPRTGRRLIISGVIVFAAYAVVEIVSLLYSPSSPGFATSYVGFNIGIEYARRILMLIAVGLVASGIVYIFLQRSQLESALEQSKKEVEDAKSSIMESEARFRSLITTTPDSVYCLLFDPPLDLSLSIHAQIARSHDAVLVECNRAFAIELGAQHPAEVIGWVFGTLDSAKDTESHEQFFSSFIANGYRLHRYELIYQDVEGRNQAREVSWSGVIEDGQLVRIWAGERSVIQQKATEAALRSRQRFQNLLAEISSQLLTAGDDSIDGEIRSSLGKVCRYTHVDRVTLAWFEKEKRQLQLLYHWYEHGDVEWSKLALQNFPWVVQRVEAAECVLIEDIEKLPNTAVEDRNNLVALGLKSLAILPLIVGGELVGAINFGTSSECRKWAKQDVLELTVLAEMFGNVIARLKSRKALENVLADLQRATDRLQAENVYLRHEIQSEHDFNDIVGESAQLLRCLKQVEQVARTNTAVLIQGETGTGKELIAHAIHERSDRHERPLVKVNCAALPSNLVESELFGHEKGAFTGATSRKRGRFDLADGGTLFLDEIGDFPLALQGKLLRVLQEGEFERLGGTETIHVDVRLIAATNREMIDAVDNGEFRADLFYRVNTYPIRLPPLRERIGDVQLLADHFLLVLSQRFNRDPPIMSAEMIEQLNAYSWPGNIRELQSVMQRALISSDGPILELAEPLVRVFSPAGVQVVAFSRTDVDLKVIEEEHIREVLEQTGWIIAGAQGAAAILGLPPSTLRSKMKRLGIERPG